MTDEEYIKNISRVSTEELFDSLEYYGCDSYYSHLWRATIEELKNRSKERPHGEWIENTDENSNSNGYCSNCGYKSIPYEEDVLGKPFCPNCGADMTGGRE